MSTDTRSGKSVYFFYFAASATLAPQLTYYYRSVGLSGREVGILAAIAPLASILGASLWGAVADLTGRHRAMLVCAIAGSIASAQLLALGAGFPTLFLFAVLLSLMYAPVMPIIDKSVLATLGSKADRYGRIRIWGAAGWGIAAPPAGLLIGRLGLGIIFPAHGALMAICLIASFRLPVGQGRSVVKIRRGLGVILRDKRWVFFLLAVFARGVGGAFIHHYLMVYLGELGASAMLRGLALTAATVSELVAFYFADRLLRRFGAERIILISIGATALRLFLHFLIQAPVAILAVQLLHGATFSIFLVAGVRLANDLAPKGMETTAQALFTATHFGAGGIVGGYIGGELLDLVGVHRMYLIASVATFLGLVAFLTFRWRTRAHR